MQGIIPAAGRGTRLRPLTNAVPKPLIPIDGRPMVTYCLDVLIDLGVEEVVIVVGNRAEDVTTHLGDRYRGHQIRYVRQESPRGLGHAIGCAADLVTGPVVILNGDNIIRGSVDSVVDRFRSMAADGVMLVERARPARARQTGVVSIDDTGRVIEMVEKPDDPPSPIVSGGFGVFSPAVVDQCASRRTVDRTGEIEFSSILDRFVRDGGDIYVERLRGWRINVNTPIDRRLAERRIRDRSAKQYR